MSDYTSFWTIIFEFKYSKHLFSSSNLEICIQSLKQRLKRNKEPLCLSMFISACDAET